MTLKKLILLSACVTIIITPMVVAKEKIEEPSTLKEAAKTASGVGLAVAGTSALYFSVPGVVKRLNDAPDDFEDLCELLACLSVASTGIYTAYSGGKIVWSGVKKLYNFCSNKTPTTVKEAAKTAVGVGLAVAGAGALCVSAYLVANTLQGDVEIDNLLELLTLLSLPPTSIYAAYSGGKIAWPDVKKLYNLCSKKTRTTLKDVYKVCHQAAKGNV